MKKFILLSSLFLIMTKLTAQQDPQYTQYMYNMSVLNPAYATGIESNLNLGALYRSQWVGAVGAPKTLTLFAHMPVNEKVEVGFSLISDDIGGGAKKENNFFADFAYLLEFNNNHKVSFGVKAGFTNLQTNFDGFVFESGNPGTDDAFSENRNDIMPNVGVGAFYFTDNYYVGLSAPNLLATKQFENRSGNNSFSRENTHVFLTAGYVFKVSEQFKFKPAVMSKFVSGAPISLDVTANLLYNEKFEFGAAYRFGDAISAMTNVKVTPSIRVGYAYDYNTSNLGQFNSGTHEIFVLFNLDLSSRGYDKSPRFF